MQFLFNDDSNLYSAIGQKDNITLPSSTKQIGSIENDIKIYVEDYVWIGAGAIILQGVRIGTGG